MQKPLSTLIDVAKKANVSPATVSRVLNQPDLVHRNTLEKVQRAIAETGFIANQAARNLRQNKSRAILVLVPHNTPLIGDLLIGMEQTASKHGYSVLVAHTEDLDGNNRNLLNYIHQSKADGIVMLGGDNQHNHLTQNKKNTWDIPTVAVNEKVNDSHALTVGIDNYQCTKALVQYLAGLGHTRIGQIAGPVDLVSSAFERDRGFNDEMQAQKLTPCWHTYKQYNMESGANAANEWVALANKPTAVVCSCDEVAFGFTSELYRNGYRVPRDLSVTGFDNIPLAKFSVPALTTVRQPLVEISETTINTLLKKITNTHTSSEDILLAGKLIVRTSTARYTN